MHIEGKMYIKDDTHNDLFIEVDISGDSSCDELIMNALKAQTGSYATAVSWNADKSCYHLEAQWDPDPDWGDDFTAIWRRLSTVVPSALISMRLERPNQPPYEESCLFDINY
jgi:hypothetical protein